LQTNNIVKTIPVDNKGGTGGSVMVGGILLNKSPVSLSQVTPIAWLTGEYDVVVIPANSPIKTITDLVAKFKANPGSVSWGGGSAGGIPAIRPAAGTASVRYPAVTGMGPDCEHVYRQCASAGTESAADRFVGQAAIDSEAIAVWWHSDFRNPGRLWFAQFVVRPVAAVYHWPGRISDAPL
jgi:hypothetical protein